MELRWHRYRYYPYERELAWREIGALLFPEGMSEVTHGIRIEGRFNSDAVERLVYFSEASDGSCARPTLQGRLERVNGNGPNRQSTRYSAHGLHEYKGKFNPQIARAILNILHVHLGARILDPFCGSGTSLVECSHLGMKAVGLDINPFAVFVANAKLSALQLGAVRLQEEVSAAIRRYKSARPTHTSRKQASDKRIAYLKNWFEPAILDEIERLRGAIGSGDHECAPALLSIASNLLRDYSLQDPNDLRTRRRKTPIPTTPFIDTFDKAANLFVSRINEAQIALVRKPVMGKAMLSDSRAIKLRRGGIGTPKFDCALTSPPYATALPYVDTQRLSLVWLELLPASEILRLEAGLVGSREVRGGSKRELLLELAENRSALPEEQAKYCRMLQSALSDKDGFRRRAVPLLLYRYFSDMAKAFRSVRGCMKDGAPFALIVGSNHTTLGGRRFDIDTPRHLAEIAGSYGWSHEETLPLQTYQRYGYHMSNAVNSERLVILRAS